MKSVQRLEFGRNKTLNKNAQNYIDLLENLLTFRKREREKLACKSNPKFCTLITLVLSAESTFLLCPLMGKKDMNKEINVTYRMTLSDPAKINISMRWSELVFPLTLVPLTFDKGLPVLH